MHYSIIAEAYEKMEETTKRLELTDLLVDLFKKTPKEVINRVVYLTQGKICADYIGLEIGVAEKLTLRALSMVSGVSIDEVEKIYGKEGDIGEAAMKLIERKTQLTLFSEPLTVERVHDTLVKIAKTSGEGAVETKLRYLASLLNDASPLEAKYIMRTVLGQLRLGVADYTVLDALTITYTGSKENREVVERAYNISSDLGEVAKALAEGGLEKVKQFKIRVGRPIRPMLAERLETSKEVLEKLGGKGAAEYKLDGERVQIHKGKDFVLLYSRRLENITSHYPDAIELCKNYINAKEFIIEGEAVAVNLDTGEYLPFQELMHRRRKYGIEKAMKEYPISLNIFDVIYVNGKDMTPLPYIRRREELEKIVAEGNGRIRVVPMIVTSDVEELERFMERAISEGCEGLVVKDLDAPYRAGAREFAWIKLKREYRSELTDTIDLVIVGAFYGKGRRAGKYGAFLLASYDRDTDTFYTTCKVGTGFTDEDLDRFPKLLEPYKLNHKHSRVNSKMEADVWFEPKIVIEIIASEITLSPIHTCAMNQIRKESGLALRFPKFTGKIRDDKAPEDATNVKEIIEMYKRQLKKITAQ